MPIKAVVGVVAVLVALCDLPPPPPPDEYICIETLMTRTEDRFATVCKEVRIYRSFNDKPALKVALDEWRGLHDELGAPRALEIIREINTAV